MSAPKYPENVAHYTRRLLMFAGTMFMLTTLVVLQPTQNSIEAVPSGQLPTITVLKTSSDGTSLGGSTFNVIPNPYNCSGGLDIIDNGSGDYDRSSGVIRMDEVCVGIEIQIKEDQAPEGYELDPTVYRVFLTDASASVTVESVAGPTGGEVADEDGDGVTDSVDQCPDTPASEPVDDYGCSASQQDDGSGDGGDTGDDYQGTPQEAINMLIEQVDDVVAGGSLKAGQAKGLKAKLQAAMKSLNQGNNKAAVNDMKAFQNQVKGFMKNGVLSTAEGQSLMDGANYAINQING